VSWRLESVGNCALTLPRSGILASLPMSASSLLMSLSAWSMAWSSATLEKRCMAAMTVSTVSLGKSLFKQRRVFRGHLAYFGFCFGGCVKDFVQCVRFESGNKVLELGAQIGDRSRLFYERLGCVFIDNVLMQIGNGVNLPVFGLSCTSWSYS
jgi:hypothetical protein